MYAVQQPLAASTLGDVMTAPAWKTLPTWFAVAQHDEVIPPDAERQFAQRMGATTVEVDSSHVVMISHPDEVTSLIVRPSTPSDAALRRSVGACPTMSRADG